MLSSKKSSVLPHFFESWKLLGLKDDVVPLAPGHCLGCSLGRWKRQCFYPSTHLYHPFTVGSGVLTWRELFLSQETMPLQWFSMPRSHRVLCWLCPSSVGPQLGPAISQKHGMDPHRETFPCSVSEKGERTVERHCNSPRRLYFFN